MECFLRNELKQFFNISDSNFRLKKMGEKTSDFFFNMKILSKFRYLAVVQIKVENC